jgi:hypothetical protein
VTLTQTKNAGGTTVNVPIAGTLVLNQATNSITFVATDTTLFANNKSPVLPDGTYTVDISSSAATDGFQALNSGGGLLDGKGTGVAGSGDYTTTFTVGAAAAGDTIVWVPATADGPGQVLNAPGTNQIGAGYPLNITTTGRITNVQVTLNYDPALLTVTGVTGNSFVDLAPTSTPGHAVVTYTGPPLGTGTQVFGYLIATVPGGTAANPTPYKAKDLITLTSVSVNGGAPVAVANAVHVVAYVGDADGNGAYSSNDAVLITRAVLQTDTGFAAYPLVDPVIVADTDGSGFIPADAALQANEAGVGFPTANLAIPPIPAGVVFQPIANNVDPALTIPASLHVNPNGTISVPVNIDDPHPAGSTGLIAGRLALTYDPSIFTVSASDVHLGSILAGGDWSIIPTIDPASGLISIALSSTTPIARTAGGSLVTIDFHQTGQARGSESVIALLGSSSPDGTNLVDAQGSFTLTMPATQSMITLSTGASMTPVSVPGALTSVTADNEPADLGTRPSGDTASVASSVVDLGNSPVATVPEASAEENPVSPIASPVAELPHVVAALHAPAAAAATSLASVNLAPVTGLVFQIGTMASAQAASAALPHWTDPLFQALGRPAAGNDLSLAGTVQILERALTSQLLLSQPVTDTLDDLNWDAAESILDWQGLGEHLPVPSSRDNQAPARPTLSASMDAAGDYAALERIFAQATDDTDLGDDD